MDFFGELERFASEDLYPYRWPILAALVVAAIVTVALAWRWRWHAAIWRHRFLSAAIAVPLLAVTIPAGWYTLSPLWERTHLEEASPLAEAAAPAAPETMQGTPVDTAPTADAPSFTPGIRRMGQVTGADDFHFGRGDAQLIETAPNGWTLRFENFSVRNGPDLFVYLTNDPESIDGAVNLGDLKATDGAFNYEIPADVDPSDYRHAIVWCRQFAVLFASAPLDPV